MPNSFFGLTIGGSGLNAANIAINTTAHNISNINTKGYSRQQTVQEASSAIRVYNTFGTAGTGVAVADIAQMRSAYYDTKYWNNNAVHGYYSGLESYSLLMEDYLDEFNLKGFTTEYENFFLAINGLRNDPNSEVSRNQFVNYAKSISEYFNTLSTNLSNVQRSANEEISSTVNTINTLAEQIASLNKQINVIEVNGGEANDLRDARALLVDELSKYVNTSVREDDIGNNMTEFYVFIDNQELVDGYDFNRLVLTSRDSDAKQNASDIDGLFDISWNTGMDFNENSTTLTGSLKSAIDIRDGCDDCYEVLGLQGENGSFLYTDKDGNYIKVTDEGKYVRFDNGQEVDPSKCKPADVQRMTPEDFEKFTTTEGYIKNTTVYSSPINNSDYKGIPYYQAQLNEFVRIFANDINSIIKQGDLGDDEVLDFFVSRFNDGYITANNISVNLEIVNDMSKLPVSFDKSLGEANTDMANALFDLKTKDTIKNGTYLEYLQSIVSVISIDTSRARSFATNYLDIKDTIDNQRLSVMGVDEDEEGVDLVKYQNAYNLASKVISVMQEIYDKLIEQTGL